MSNSESTPGSERRNLLFNLVMFTITGLVLVVYTCTFISHILAGLASSLTDELLLLAMICCAGFYGIALNQSYQTYVRTNGSSFSIGPFTILSTSILPSSATFVAPPTPMTTSQESSQATFERFSPKMDTPGMMYDVTPRQSLDATVCPPTPDSVASNQTPMLVTPHMDALYYKSAEQETPSRMSAKINRYRLGGINGGRGKPGFEDVEKGPEMYGLGMGDIGSDEPQGVRP
ncbi:hypothetical protein FFLO_01013 [Filobasidium floriforme]|uniref:Uncharacterized protein n=1 Tax=Filobasidium floriforme TaxID=5210 RepID=A0A8K0JR60_9TREE|nr:hypothetical protein FFLO_01013 [Filobasidium floriforme]